MRRCELKGFAKLRVSTLNEGGEGGSVVVHKRYLEEVASFVLHFIKRAEHECLVFLKEEAVLQNLGCKDAPSLDSLALVGVRVFHARE